MREQRKPPLQRAPILMMPVLVMALAASCAKLLWMVVAPVQDVSAAPIMAVVAPTISQQPKNFGQIIANNHLFGEVPKTAPRPILPKVAQQAPPAPVEPAEPPLKLSLHGLWAKKRSQGRTDTSFKAIPINKPKDLISQLNAELDSLFVLNVAESAKNVPPEKTRGGAFAIISQEGGEQLMYSEGENIADEVKVLEIFADKVIVENRGVKQDIFLSDGGNSTVVSASAGARKVPRSTRAQSSPRPNVESAPRKRNENLGQQDLRKLRTDIMNDVSILAQYSAPEPLLMDGEVKGFRLHLSNRLRLLYQIGFRPGDVITELNGVRLNNPDTVRETLYNFIGAEQLSVSVMRGQQEETFRYNFEG